jgi:hypothetical protein
MKVKMKGWISGTRNGVPWPAAGGVVDLPDPEAAKLCASGMAEPVAEKASDKAEKAVAPEPETREESGLTTKRAPTRSGSKAKE